MSASVGLGCSAPAAPPPGVVELRPVASAAPVTASASPRESDAPPGKCVVRGTKLPYDGCDALLLEVSQTISGRPRGIARIKGDADVTITFEGKPARVSVVATSGALRVRGALDPSEVWLPLVRPVEVASGHVKVFRGAPVRVRDVSGEAVGVDVWMGFGGVETFPGAIRCTDLAFEPVALERIASSAPSSLNPQSALQPKKDLALFDAPNGKELMRIEAKEPTGQRGKPPRAHPGIPRAANLDLLEQRSGYARVTFEGTFVAVDAWVREVDIEVGPVQGFGGGYGCGTGSGSFKGKPARVVRDTRLSLGTSAADAVPVDVEILRGAEVKRGVEEGGLVWIQIANDPIQPPTSFFYLIDPGALE